jgi:NADH:ubiquinone oxidoreductase subunit 5 (subunit L)/multisubunit Na+/H+ antiporter MnhA subunit
VSFYTVAWLVVLLPLLGWSTSFLAATPRRSAQISVAFCGLAFLAAVALLGYRCLHQSVPYESVISFWEVRPVESGVFAATLTPMVGVRVDALSTALMAVVTFVSLVVQWHAIVLMKADQESRRLFQVIAFFTVAALALAASPNLFQFLLMWEVLGIAAYVLAGHWWTSLEAAAAARRAFLYLRIGDLALVLAVVFTYVKFGPHASTQPAPAGSDVSDPLSFAVLSGSTVDASHAGEWHLAHSGFVLGVGMRTLVTLAVLLLVAAAVRACQFPFHAWLTEVADAPPPALALIASVLTASGVVLMARVYPLFIEIPHLLTAIAALGTATALLCAAIALLQRDLIRLALLATGAQISLVVVALGTGGYSRALFALVVTMLSTTLLFLAVSNIIRSYRTQEISAIAGLWNRMRWTSIGLCFWVAGVCGSSLVNYNVLASVFRNQSPAGGHLGSAARGAIVIGVVLAMAAIAIGAARLAVGLLSGTPVPRRGVQPERIVEGDPRLRRALAAITAGAVLVVLASAVPRLSFTRFVYFGDRAQTLEWDLAAALTCVVLAGVAFATARLGARGLAASLAGIGDRLGSLDAGPALARLVAWPLMRASRAVTETDEAVLDGISGGAGQGVMSLGGAVAQAVTPRLNRQLAVSLIAVGVLTAAAVLAATGHLPGGL